ncbi:MAG: serine/threonine protein kinase [Deltaproteobacteria bacterium]|nr:serine/threonine protein kinase [Deltaproteobacteria bacterium]
MLRRMAEGVGDIIGDRYRVERQLGRGGFATTWAARDLHTGTEVAAKVLDIRALDDWKSVELFEREARVLRRLDHPGIPRYVDFLAPTESGDGATRMVLVQELAPGESLAARIVAGWRGTEAEIVEIARKILDILVWLQALEPPVIHRDIKPANLIVDDAGAVRLVDFGAVRDTLASHTSLGSTVVGTFGYMAPEQFQGTATPQSDLYALGATLVTLLSHKEPADIGHERMRLAFHDHVSVSEPFRDWLDRMLEPVAEDRFPSAAEARRALDAPPAAREPAPSAPAGTRMALDRDRRRFALEIPPSRSGALATGGFAIFWLSFVAFWTFSAVAMDAPIFFVLFSVPFWLVGLGMVGHTARRCVVRTSLQVDREDWRLERSWFGRRHRVASGRTRDLTGFDSDVPVRVNGCPVHRLVLREGTRAHKVASPVQPVEAAWLERELTGWLAESR